MKTPTAVSSVEFVRASAALATNAPRHPIPALTSRSPWRRGVLLATLAALTLGLSGCMTISPRERGTLTDYTMRSDRDKLHDAMTEHIHFSREAAAGGRGVGGGGCGCN